jgi:hypothetical protein
MERLSRRGVGLCVSGVKFCVFLLPCLRLMWVVGRPGTEWKQRGPGLDPHIVGPLEDHGALNARVFATRPEDSSGGRGPRSPP